MLLGSARIRAESPRPPIGKSPWRPGDILPVHIMTCPLGRALQNRAGASRSPISRYFPSGASRPVPARAASAGSVDANRPAAFDPAAGVTIEGDRLGRNRNERRMLRLARLFATTARPFRLGVHGTDLSPSSVPAGGGDVFLARRSPAWQSPHLRILVLPG